MMHKILCWIEVIRSPSDARIGFLIAAVCAIIALYPLMSESTPHWWLLAIGVVLFVLALAKPGVLAPFNYIWMRLGPVLGGMVIPIVLILIYYPVILPVAMAMKLAGRDPLGRKLATELGTYWQEKDPVGPPSDDMRNQF